MNSSLAMVPGSAAYPTVRSERWELDRLGNWSGNVNTESPQGDPCVLADTTIPAGSSGPGVHTVPCVNCVMASGVVPGHSVVFDEEGEERQTVLWEAHGTEQGVAHEAEAIEVLFGHQPNAVKTVLNLPVGVAGAGAWNPPNAGRAWRKQYTDPCGNLTFDGEYFYQYDAWNRLVQVNRGGNLTAWRFDKWGMPQHLEAGFIRPSSCGIPAELGELVKHQTYDGVGRVIRTSSPIQAPEGWEFEAGEGGGSAPDPWFTRSERFYYDGVRRIQEVVTDPIVADGEGNRVATMSFENDNRNGNGNGGSGGGGAASVLPTVSVFLRAQYVWGPGDNGVDELLCQIEPDQSLAAPEGDGGTNGHGPRGKPWYILTDAQGDVASIVGVTQDLSGNQNASVAGQWTYSPYGEVLTYDRLDEHPAVVFGHKTLVMDRLDGPTLTWQDESEPGAEDWTFFETRRLEPGARLIAYARNRTLDVQRGRWLQVDPNGSGLLVTDLLRFHGQTPTPGSFALNVQSRVADGMSVCVYSGGNPIVHSDPTGLFISLPGLLMTGADAMSNVADQFDDAAMGLRTAFGMSAMLDAYQFNQELMADSILDWNTSDDMFNGLTTSGAASSFMAEAQQAGFTEFNQPELYVADAHRIVQGFAGGTYDPLNVANLTPEQHQRYHRLLEEKFRLNSLNPPNSRGDNNWRQRFSRGEVKSPEKARMRKAVLEASSAFDVETKNEHNLRQRAQKIFATPNVSGHLTKLKKVKRGLRR